MIVAWRVIVIALAIALLAADIYAYWFYSEREPFRSLKEIQTRLFGGYSPRLTVSLAYLPQAALLAGLKICLEKIFKIRLTPKREWKKK